MANIQYQYKAASILKDTRKASGKKQEEMAKLMGVTKQTIISWEKGYTFPKLPDVIMWFDILHIDGSIINKHSTDTVLSQIIKEAQTIIDIAERERSLK